MNIIYQTHRITQALDHKAAERADLLTDAAAGWALIRQLEAKFATFTVKRICSWCDIEMGEVEAHDNKPTHGICEACKVKHFTFAQQAPADLVAAFEEYQDKGIQYVTPGIDWSTVQSEPIGD